MAGREEYNACIRPYMVGQGLTREARQLRFCAGAKICTGKARTEDEAVRICQAQPPKPPTVRMGRGKLDAGAIAACLFVRLTPEITEPQLAVAISECSGRRIKKPPTDKQLIKKCVLEHTVKGTFAESVSLQKKCRKELVAGRTGAQ